MSKPTIFPFSTLPDPIASVWSGHCDDMAAADDAPTLDELLDKISALALDSAPPNPPSLNPDDIFIEIAGWRESAPFVA